MIRIIEKSTLEFAENLAKLETTLFSTAWDRDTINDKINRGEFLYWVYEQDDKIVGYLAIQKTLNALHKKFGGRWVLKGAGTLIGPAQLK